MMIDPVAPEVCASLCSTIMYCESTGIIKGLDCTALLAQTHTEMNFIPESCSRNQTLGRLFGVRCVLRFDTGNHRKMLLQ